MNHTGPGAVTMRVKQKTALNRFELTLGNTHILTPYTHTPYWPSIHETALLSHPCQLANYCLMKDVRFTLTALYKPASQAERADPVTQS